MQLSIQEVIAIFAAFLSVVSILFTVIKFQLSAIEKKHDELRLQIFKEEADREKMEDRRYVEITGIYDKLNSLFIMETASSQRIRHILDNCHRNHGTIFKEVE